MIICFDILFFVLLHLFLNHSQFSCFYLFSLSQNLHFVGPIATRIFFQDGLFWFDDGRQRFGNAGGNSSRGTGSTERRDMIKIDKKSTNFDKISYAMFLLARINPEVVAARPILTREVGKVGVMNKNLILVKITIRTTLIKTRLPLSVFLVSYHS